MTKVRIFLTFLFLLISTITFAQEVEIENLLENQEEYSDISELVQTLSELEKNPIDINSASIDQLTILPWISTVQAIAMIRFREKNGKFRSIDDLFQVNTLSPSTIEAIEKYITFAPTVSFSDFSFNFKSRINRKIEESIGLQNGKYHPSPFKYYNRFLMSYNNSVSFGGLLEKDSGEKNFDDLSLFFLKFENQSSGDRLILGNYRLEFGNGLLFWNPYGYSKSSAPLYAAKRRGQGLKEYTLVDENASLCGIAAKKCLKIYQFFIFYSRKKLDATLNLDGSVKNFYAAGYHRTDIEMEKRNNVEETLVGGRVQIQPIQTIKLGLTFYNSQYNRLISLTDIYRSRFAFNGRKNHVLGTDFNVTYHTLNFFGEAGISKNKGYGVLTGILLHAGQFDFVTSVRVYSKDFISLHGQCFSTQRNHPQNERGLYLGAHYNVLKNLKLSFYFDQYKFPWRTYFIPMPAKGHEMLFKISHKPAKGLWLYVQTKLRQKDQMLNSEDNWNREIKIVHPRNQLNVRFQLDYKPWSFFRLRQRMEQVRVNYHKNINTLITQGTKINGLLLYNDILFNINKKLSISARLSYFDTNNYDSRVYQFERDVPGMMTNYMLYGRGSRWYGYVQYKLKSFLRLSLKFSSTQYLHVNSVGTGSDKIVGNTINSVNFQMESNW